jgi:catechol 2,3-dioxygenase-like lactoylglutathione lyase family enzyme
MLTHVTPGTNDISRSKLFYDAAPRAIGLALHLDERSAGWIGYSRPGELRPEFLICYPRDGAPATFGNGTTIGFDGARHELVDRFYAAALEAGGGSAGGPGLQPHYHPNFYAAYVRDPDGHKLC